MSKLLVITYYFPPARGAASDRPLSWYNHLNDRGIFPTILTRNWNGNEKEWKDFIIADSNGDTKHAITNNNEIYFIPYFAHKWYKRMHLTKPWNWFIIRNIISFLGKSIYGNEWSINLKSFESNLKSIIRLNSFDAVLITLPPQKFLNIVDTVKSLTSIPVIIDFRDLWTNEVLKFEAHSNIKPTKLEVKIAKKLEKVQGVTVVSSPMKDHVKRIGFTKSIKVIYNGFNESEFNNFKIRKTKFNITILGYIYPQQDAQIMIGAFSKLLELIPEMEIKFIGAASLSSTYMVFNQTFAKWKDRVEYTERLPKIEAINYLQEASILYYIGWKGYKGVVSTKIFDYMASGIPVIIAPGDNDVIDELVVNSNCGTIENDIQSVVNRVQYLFELWKKDELKIDRNLEYINLFSRKCQAYEMANFIEEIINESKLKKVE